MEQLLLYVFCAFISPPQRIPHMEGRSLVPGVFGYVFVQKTPANLVPPSKE
jgi:hypothetical protein